MTGNSSTPTAFTQDIYCQDCGYNLRGLTSEQCPECGRSLEGLRSSVSQIPWVHRREIGRFKSYWKTVWFGATRHRQFIDELARPVNFQDSQKFRWTTVAIVFVTTLACDLVLWIQLVPSPWDDEIIGFVWSDVWMNISLLLGFLALLAAVTGIPSYFYHPNEVSIPLQNRAIALSYYASGTLSLIFVPSIAATIYLHEPRNDPILIFCALLMIIGPILLTGIWWVTLDHLSIRLLPDRRVRTIMTTLMLPLLWLFLFAIIMVFVPLVSLYIAIIASSFF